MIATYTCEKCRRVFTARSAAIACEAQPVDKAIAKIGDIVHTASTAFGWFDGDPKWVIDLEDVTDILGSPPARGEVFGGRAKVGFYYVVTAIDEHEHRVRYHLFTKAMSGASGYHDGYTFNSGHYKPELVAAPPIYVRRTSKELIGKKSDHLL